MKNTIRAWPAMLLPAIAQAHDGHGAAGTHLHPEEVMGLVALAAVIVLVVARFWKK